MLFRQNFGRCHQGDLPAATDRPGRGERCHDGFSAPNVALKQTMHGLRTTEVPTNLGDDAGLSAGQSKRQLCQQPTFHRIVAQWRRANLISLGPRASQRELLGNEFIQNDSTPWRTLTVVLFSLRRRIGWQWGVEGFDRLSEPRHSEFTDQIGRNRLP
jgi:hypothetical protein